MSGAEGRPTSRQDWERRIREMNEALLVSSVRHHEIADEARKAEATLRKSEERFRGIFEQALVGIAELDLEGRFVLVNEGYCRLVGRSAAELYGLSFRDITHPDDVAGNVSLFRRAVSEGTPYVLDKRYVLPDRKHVWVRNNVSILRDRDRSPTNALVVSVEMTERKRAEEALRGLNDRLEQRVAERTAELASQNEQLRRLASQLAEAEQRERRKVAKTLHDGLQQILVAGRIQLRSLSNREDATGAVERLGILLEEAIATSRSLSYELSPPVLQSSGLPEALRWLARWFRAQHRFQVELRVGEGLPVVSEDVKTFLFHAARELLLNSAKHSGGSAARMELHAPRPERLCLTVADEGSGFDPAMLDRENEQPGFGLFAIRERLSALGGALRIQSSPGKGTRFDLELPLAGEEGRKEPP